MAKIFILSTKPISTKMGGPALRCWEMAKILAEENEVVLGIPNKPEFFCENFKTVQVNIFNIWKFLSESEIIISHHLPAVYLPYTLIKKKIFVLDFYNLVFFENLDVMAKDSSSFLKKNPEYALKSFEANLLCADYILCSGEKQRDVIIGMLLALSRIEKDIYKREPNLKGFIDIVGFGIPLDEPVKTNQVVKGVIPGINRDDFLLIWSGGLWEWFDLTTLINAVAIAARQNSKIKLLFMGRKLPVSSALSDKKLDEIVKLSKELNLFDKYVFFQEWVSYEKRADYYIEADSAVITHNDILETRYSFRIRFMDSLWARLPVICSRGDQHAKLVEDEQLGIAISIGNEFELAEAILKMARDKEFREKCRKNIGDIRKNFKWEKVLSPLVNFCKNPRKTPHKAGVFSVSLKVFSLFFDRLILSKFRK
ncbi:MAG: glycosyltransferase [Armatimonadota bacterium]